MSESYNLDNVLKQQNAWMNTKFTAAEAAQKAMEERDIKRAEEAVGNVGFLGLTVGEKLKELGIGERVMQQVADTATGIVTGVINPLTEYLNKYEKVFDEAIYNSELQGYAKQMFFSQQALAKEANAGAYIVGLNKDSETSSQVVTGTQFSMDM